MESEKSGRKEENQEGKAKIRKVLLPCPADLQGQANNVNTKIESGNIAAQPV